MCNVFVSKRKGEMWESREGKEEVIKRLGWKEVGVVREGDIVIMIGNVGRILREGKDMEMEKLMRSEVKIMGICYGYEYLVKGSGGEIEEGKRKRGLKNGEWYNHHDSVKRLGKEWKGKKKWGRWKEGETRKWKGYQYHPEHNKKTMKRMLYVIEKWKKECNTRKRRRVVLKLR